MLNMLHRGRFETPTIPMIICILLAVLILLAAVPVNAQNSPPDQTTLPARRFDVPADGYSGIDTYNITDMWNEYRVNVPRNHELEYHIQSTGQDNFTVYLIPNIGAEYLLQGSYYISYSSHELVNSFSRVFPADPGYAYEYTIVVNATHSTANVTYTISISINEVDTPDYTIYYVLIVLGGIGLVVFSWQFVKRQMKKERQAEMAARKKRESRRGKRR